jgi:hypothetical protein
MRNVRKRGIMTWAGVTLIGVMATTAAAQMTARKPAHQEKRLQEVRQLSADSVASSIEIADDDLETVATLTTARGFLAKRGGGFLDTLTSDNMLRAMVSKADGRTSWQLYQTVRYSESDWRHFTSVNYETVSGPRHAQLTVINTDVRCNYGICAHEETIGFELPEDLLEAIVANNVGRPDAVWRFRFNAKSGFHWTDDMPVTEIAGALQAVKHYRTQKGFE